MIEVPVTESQAGTEGLVPVIADVVWPTNLPATIEVLSLGGTNDVVNAFNSVLSDGALCDIIYPIIRLANSNITQIKDCHWVNYNGKAAIAFQMTIMVKQAATATATATTTASTASSAYQLQKSSVSSNCSPGLESAVLEDIGALVIVAGVLGSALLAAVDALSPEIDVNPLVLIVVTAVSVIAGLALITVAPIVTALYCQAQTLGLGLTVGITAILLAAAGGIGFYAYEKSKSVRTSTGTSRGG